jgi:hypothetical protein
MNELKKYGNSITDVINSLTKWVSANPQAAASILRIVAGLATFNLGVGASKLLFGNLLGVFASGGTAFLKITRYFKGFGESFSFLTKVMGGGKISSFFRAFTFGTKLDGVTKTIMSIGSKAGSVFKTLGTGALNAGKSVLDVGAKFLLTGAKALIAGGKMALAWVIGLGPIGWIIAGVTAIVIAAVVAWKTNFLGFRDKAKEIFSVIGQFIGGVVDGIRNAWDSAIGWISKKLETLWGYAQKLLDNPVVKGIISGAKWVGSEISGLVNGKSEQTIKNSNSSSYSDNRNYTYNINSTDPRLAAAQISNNDKYVRSRNP